MEDSNEDIPTKHQENAKFSSSEDAFYQSSSFSVPIKHFPIDSNRTTQNVKSCIDNFNLCQNSICFYAKSVCLQLYRRQRQIIIPFIWGILVGIAFTTLVFQQRVLLSSAVPYQDSKLAFNRRAKDSPMVLGRRYPSLPIKDSVSNITDFSVKNRLYVGVITAEKFLSSRALAVNNTWGHQVDKIEFFAQHGTPEKFGVPVVNLDHISDTEYPPQRKAFEMLKYMCSHHIDDFEWFVRADDDVYIRVERLKRLLAQVDTDRVEFEYSFVPFGLWDVVTTAHMSGNICDNCFPQIMLQLLLTLYLQGVMVVISSEAYFSIYMGQPGHGVQEMKGKLGLKGHNFCMGGPGVIFNRKALKGLCPHIDDCIAGVVSGEEDVEIGRCVTNYLHIECTHAWDTLKLFYHSYQEEYAEDRPFLGVLKENEHVERAITLHHLKLPSIMYRVHRHYNAMLLIDSDRKLNYISAEMNLLDHQNIDISHTQRPEFLKNAGSLIRRNPGRDNWRTFTTESFFSLSPAYITRDITNDAMADLKQVCETAIDLSLEELQVQKVIYSHVIDGALHSDYLNGTAYQIDINFQSKLHQHENMISRVDIFRPAGRLEVSSIKRSETTTDKKLLLVFVALHASKSVQFEIFMRNFFEPVFLASGRSSSTRLVAISMDSHDDSNHIRSWSLTPSIEEILDEYRRKYPDSRLEVLPQFKAPGHDSHFSTQLGFAQAISHAQKTLEKSGVSDLKNALVLLTTTNITLSHDVMNTCTLRTFSAFNNTDTEFHNYDFINYKSRKKKGVGMPSQIYQPIPFFNYPGALVGPWPTAMVPQSTGLKPGLGGVPMSMVKSGHGFWSNAIATGDEEEVIAPLCGSLKDFNTAVIEALKRSNNSRTNLNFKDALYERIYAGKLKIFRVPDRSYSSIPTR